MNERGRRRNNIWLACKFPFGRKQAASRGGKARREHDENKCVYRDRRQPISAITLCLLYRSTDVSTITDRVNDGRERKRKKKRKRKEVNPDKKGRLCRAESFEIAGTFPIWYIESRADLLALKGWFRRSIFIRCCGAQSMFYCSVFSSIVSINDK